MDFLSISWMDLEKDTYKLAQKIKKAKPQFDLIVAIARGGLSIAHLLTDYLQLPITSFTVISYRDLQQQKTAKVTFKIGSDIQKKRVLLVDDVSDSGRTFIRGTKYLQTLGVKKISTAALFMKPWSIFKPDYFQRKTQAWIIFPYEIRETTEALVKKYQQEGKSKTEIRMILKKLNISNYFYP